MKRAFGGVLLAVLMAVPAYAQAKGDPIKKGSFEVGGASSFTFTRTSYGSSNDIIESGVTNGEGGSSSNSVSSTVLILNGTGAYYMSNRLGIGAVVGITHFGIPSSDLTPGFGLTATTVGGLVKYRFPMGGPNDKAKDFFILGTAGVSIFSAGGSASGPMFSIGAGMDIFMTQKLAFTIGAQYQHSSLSGLGASGIAVGLGFTVVLK